MTTDIHLERKIREAEAKAFDSLARYKFMPFGYWAAIWIHLSRVEGKRRKNPFKDFVLLARWKQQHPMNTFIAGRKVS